MDNSNLWKEVLTNSKKSYQASYDENSVLRNTVANFGLGKNQCCIRTRDGEYTDFSIKTLENIKPLLTNVRVSSAIKFLNENNITSAINKLQIEDYVKKYGVNILYYILKEWLEFNNFTVPVEYLNFSEKISNVGSQIKEWIKTVRYNPIKTFLKIILCPKVNFMILL